MKILFAIAFLISLSATHASAAVYNCLGNNGDNSVVTVGGNTWEFRTYNQLGQQQEEVWGLWSESNDQQVQADLTANYLKDEEGTVLASVIENSSTGKIVFSYTSDMDCTKAAN